MMAPLSVEEDNYIRLVFLLVGVCTRAVRSFFDEKFPSDNLFSSFNTNYNILYGLKFKKNLSQTQWDQLFPRNGDQPNSNNFDVTLMICLIRNLTSIASPSYGFDNLPQQCETTPGSDLARIKWYRNQLAHQESGTCTINSADFNTTWEHIADAVGRLGGERSENECKELKSKTLDRNENECKELESKTSEWLLQKLLIESTQSQADIRDLKDIVARLPKSENKCKKGCLKRKKEEKATIPKTIHDLLCFGNCIDSAQSDITSSTNSDSSTASVRTDLITSSPGESRDRQCFPNTLTDNLAGVAIGNPRFRSGLNNHGFVPDSVHYDNTHSSVNIFLPEQRTDDPEHQCQCIGTKSKNTFIVIAVCLGIVGALAFTLYYKHNLGGSNIFNDPENTNVLLTQDKCEKDVTFTLIGQRICIPYTQMFTDVGRYPLFIYVRQLSSKFLRALKVFTFNVLSATFVQKIGDWIVNFNSSRHEQQIRFVQEKATCDNVGKYEITIKYSGGNVTSFVIEIVLKEPTLNLNVRRINDSIYVHCEMTNNCKSVSLGLIVNDGNSSRVIPTMNDCNTPDRKSSSKIIAEAIIPVSWFSGNQIVSCVPLMTDPELAANLTSTMSIPVCEGDSCEPNCKEDPHGIAYFQDKHFCNIFYQCSNGDTFLQECEDGTSWSHSKCTCVHFDNEICDRKTYKFFKPAMSFEKCAKS